MFTHRLDDADLYFQHTRSESWSLEEGIVKSGSFNIDQGVGVRAIYGDKTAFAYSDEINLEALTKAAKATRVIGPQGGKQAVASKLFNPISNKLYSDMNPLDSLQPKEKIALLESIERRAKARDPRIIQVMASLAGEFDVVLVVRADGLLAADVRPLVRVSVHVIAEQNGRRES
jgi:TldD protein